MNSISNFFKEFDAFLTKCVEYIDNRVITGKFIKDIAYLLSLLARALWKKSKKFYIILKKSPQYSIAIKNLDTIFQLLLKIPLFNLLFRLLVETLRIIITCYSEIFIVFALTFPAAIILLNWFQTSIITFCIALIPVIFINIICVAALYYCIERRESGDKISIWKSILFVLRHITSISFPVLIESAIILEIFVVFIIISLMLTSVFNLLQIAWGGSVVYWFIVCFTASLMFITFFILSVLMPQTFFTVIIDHLPFYQALQRSRTYIKSKISYYLFLYILLYLFCGIFTWHAILSYLYIGLTVGIYSTLALGIFLGFLLRRRFVINLHPHEIEEYTNQKIHFIFIILIIFGVINYIMISTLLVKEYQSLITFVQKEQNDYLASQEIKQYTNTSYGYSIRYPQNWTFYQWQNNSVTFYNNYTDTLPGGTWMTITISPYTGSLFDALSNATPGIVEIDPKSKDIITKVSNITIQGYAAVNYLYTRSAALPYTQYEEHYLIHKDDHVYDISFTSVTNDVGIYNSDLFQKIIDSFRFTQ
jgi:hypothetical protein